MKPVFAKVMEDLKGEVYAFRSFDLPFFSTEFHFHRECQLVYVMQSEGKRIVGDSVEDFSGDELILLGSDIPHVWHNDNRYFSGEAARKINARSVALFFHPDRLIALLSRFMSTVKLEGVLNRSQQGMKFTGSEKERIRQLLLGMATQDELNRFVSLLRIIEQLVASKEYELLAGDGYTNTYQAKDSQRVDKVFRYIFDHFGDDIRLEDAAALVHMNKQAFCRFFKSRTQKTFVEFVNDVRISHACRMMTSGDHTIGALAYECGFNSISNFNRFFKTLKRMTPREYRKKVLE
ncbi:AraC family transcriptional regulator [Niabella aurantiaca]|uniref:AraC family transcriptional regulator n=1 Tax=Niabella aurantiaca TaxID=379900 RepID=UPI00146A9733|nr:AraC family transcriptional regulator [Niabella aurantiaca]